MTNKFLKSGKLSFNFSSGDSTIGLQEQYDKLKRQFIEQERYEDLIKLKEEGRAHKLNL